MATKRKKNANGYFEIRRKVPEYRNNAGKLVQYKRFYGTTVKEAEEKYAEYMRNLSVNPIEDMRVGELIEDFITNNLIPSSKHKESTKQRYIDAYRKNLKEHPSMNIKIKNITYKDLQTAYNDMTCAPSGISSCQKLLMLFFNFMVMQGVLMHNPAIGLSIPKPAKKSDGVVVFTDEEIQKILEHLSKDLPYYQRRRAERLRFLIILDIKTGLRVSELLALTYDDFSSNNVRINKQLSKNPIFSNGEIVGYETVISETKTGAGVRNIPITDEVYQAFLNHKKWHQTEMANKHYQTNYVFTTSVGTNYDKRSLRHTLDRFHKDAGVPCYGLHTYRRTFGTKLASEGVKDYILTSLMGHTNFEVTRKYYVNISDAEKFDAISKLQ